MCLLDCKNVQPRPTTQLSYCKDLCFLLQWGKKKKDNKMDAAWFWMYDTMGTFLLYCISGKLKVLHSGCTELT